MLKEMKTNAVRILEQQGIHFELREYEVDESDLSAATVAKKIGMPLEQVFKTLLAKGDREGLLMAVVPGDSQLNLKAIAQISENKRVEMVPLKDVQPLTGYIRGGVTAIGSKKQYPVYLDETAELFDIISISAGVRGTQVLIAPADYIRLTNAKLGALSM